MKLFALAAVALLAAGPAFALSQAEINRTARIAAERNDPWHIKHLGPVNAPTPVVQSPREIELAPNSVVPEPASWAMMVGGFGVIGGALRRRGMARVAA